MIGFLLGHNLTRRRLRELGRPVIVMSIGEIATTALLVFPALSLLTRLGVWLSENLPDGPQLDGRIAAAAGRRRDRHGAAGRAAVPETGRYHPARDTGR
jgi:hypothetical protein